MAERSGDLAYSLVSGSGDLLEVGSNHASMLRRILENTEAVLAANQRLEGRLQALTEGGALPAVPSEAGFQRSSTPVLPRTSSNLAKVALQRAQSSTQGSLPSEASQCDVCEQFIVPASYPERKRLSQKMSEPQGFFSKLADAEATLGKENILPPPRAKEFLMANPNCLYLDVQDASTEAIPGTHRVSLGTLYFKASADIPDFRDPTLTDRSKDDPILVTCGLGGQAKLAGALLMDYGYSNVKTVDGGCLAWKRELLDLPLFLPVGWPASLTTRVHAEGQATQGLEWSTPSGRNSAKLLRSRSGGALDRLRPQTSSRSIITRDVKKAPAERGRFLLTPTSKIRVVLDVMSIVFLGYDLVTVPMLLAWGHEMSSEELHVHQFALAFWTIDMLASARTGYFDQGHLVLEQHKIAKRYFRTWFSLDLTIILVDFASLHLILLEGPDSRIIGIFRFAKWGRILRLAGMLRVMRCADIVERILDRTMLSASVHMMAKVCELLFVILYLNHITGCMWYALGRIGSSSDTGLSWLHTTVGFSDDDRTYEQVSFIYQYLSSLHWAMAQILAGNTSLEARNSFERVFNMVCLLVGLLLFSTLVSTISSKMTHLRMLQQEQRSWLLQLHRFIRTKNVDPQVGMAVVKQVKMSMQERKPVDLTSLEAWRFMSQANKDDMHWEVCRPILLQHRFFLTMAQCHPDAIAQIGIKGVSFKSLMNQEVLFCPGEKCEHVYSVVIGRMEYTQVPGSSLVAAKTRTSLKERDWFCEGALWTTWTHVGKMAAAQGSELMAVSVARVVDTLSLFPDLCTLAAEYGRAFHERAVAGCPPAVPYPSDVGVAFSTFVEIVPTLSESARTFIGMSALQAVAASSSWVHHHQLHEVGKEIQAGRLTVVASSDGNIEEVSSTVSIRLRRPGDQVLVLLGKWTGVSATAWCRLPHTEVREGEHPETARLRLMNTVLYPFVATARVETFEQHPMSSPGPHRSRSTCTETLFDMSCGLDVDGLREMPVIQQKYKDADIRIFPEAGGAFWLCAWLDDTDVEPVLRSSAAQAEVKQLLAEVHICFELLDRAAAIVSPSRKATLREATLRDVCMDVAEDVESAIPVESIKAHGNVLLM